MTDSAPTFVSDQVHSITRPNLVTVGTIIWLSSELMFFAGLFGTYFTVRAAHLPNWPQAPTKLDVPFDLCFTIILVLSSITCQFAVFAAEQGRVFPMRRWFVLTFFMGATFLGGQSYEFSDMVEKGTTISSSDYGSVFYITTGFHALHVLAGLAAFVFLLIRSKLGPFTPAQATGAIVVSYYWHFVDLIWIGLFTTIFLIQ